MIKWLTEELAVAGQITAQDIPQIAQLGFKSIICNRPDNEELGQPGFSLIDKAAGDAGLETRFIPVVSGHATSANVEDFAVAVKDLPKPVLAYCRSGARCTNLWIASQSQR